MATEVPTQDEVFKSLVQCVRNGAEMDLEEEAVETLRARYYAWIVKPGEKDGKEYPTPQDVWGHAEGELLQRQFGRIGRQAAHRCRTLDMPKVGAKETGEEAVTVEADDENRCPWCKP